jgi:6-phosphogluconolactonase
LTAIRVLPDSEALAEAAARHVVEASRTAVNARGRFLLTVSGGTTPRALHELLAAAPLIAQVDWPRVHVFFGDERCVPPDDNRSNFRMAEDTLLARVPIAPAAVHRIRGELPPYEAAAEYDAELRAFFGAEPPRMDLVLLGMGDNGHTASLFPRLAAVHEQERLAVAEYVQEVGMWRITLTPVILNMARETLFLVSGSGKAGMLRRVLEGPYIPDELPAQIVRPVDGSVIWLVDGDAAANLSPAPG